MAIHRGEIYFVNLNPAHGREQAGTRPVLVHAGFFARINNSFIAKHDRCHRFAAKGAANDLRLA